MLIKIWCYFFGHTYPKGFFDNLRCINCGDWAFNPDEK